MSAPTLASVTNTMVAVLLVALFAVQDAYSQVRVRAYYRKDGTYVRSHTRSYPGTRSYSSTRSYPETRSTSPSIAPVYIPPPAITPAPPSQRDVVLQDQLKRWVAQQLELQQRQLRSKANAPLKLFPDPEKPEKDAARKLVLAKDQLNQADREIALGNEEVGHRIIGFAMRRFQES